MKEIIKPMGKTGSVRTPTGSARPNMPISKTQKTTKVAPKMTVSPKKKEIKTVGKWGSTRGFQGPP